MERIVAVKKLSKMLGRGFGYQIDAKAPNKEEREAAKLELIPAQARRDKLKQQKNERFEALLKGDAEYQALHAAYIDAVKKCQEIGQRTRRRKITVGNSHSIGGFGMFSVKAEGDSWEEVIDKVSNGK